MTRSSKTILSLALAAMIPASAFAGFDWGGNGACDGSGSFQQQISQGGVATVGDIPVGKEGVYIKLLSDEDVDIQLFDSESGAKLVEWPDGTLNGATSESMSHYGMSIEYSGYNGDGTGLGHEYIKITGATSRLLTMKAYGYAAGYATVDYSWTGTEGCSTGPADSGAGSFEQYIEKDAVVEVGELVEGLSDVTVYLRSDEDVDIQLVDTRYGNKIVHWPSGMLKGATTESTTYAGLTIEYSGYNGDGTGLGHEYIKVTGTLDRSYTLSAYGYAAGYATVDYSWGDGESSSVASSSVSSVSSSSFSSVSSASSSSAGSDQWDDYYADALGKSGSALKSALNSIIKGHTTLSYSNVWNALKDTDEDPDNSGNVILLYKQTSQSKSTNGGDANDWNREHVWAKSHGNFGTAQGPGTDVHHLRPTDVTVNSARGNKDFDNGGSTVSEAPLCKTDSDSWEAPDEVKGDVARMIFYMATRYEGNDGYPDLEVVDYQTTGTKNPVHGKLSVLLQWHHNDPVSDFERSRNDKIYFNWQGNRNPFIDHPEWVDEIWD